MLRVVVYLLLALVLITLLRGIAGIVAKAFRSLADPAPERPPEGRRPVGELKRDPVCGTYVATDAAVKRTVRGEVVHFCSTACRDKYERPA
jgi:YHS domain-containing protein